MSKKIKEAEIRARFELRVLLADGQFSFLVLELSLKLREQRRRMRGRR